MNCRGEGIAFRLVGKIYRCQPTIETSWKSLSHGSSSVLLAVPLLHNSKLSNSGAPCYRHDSVCRDVHIRDFEVK